MVTLIPAWWLWTEKQVEAGGYATPGQVGNKVIQNGDQLRTFMIKITQAT